MPWDLRTDTNYSWIYKLLQEKIRSDDATFKAFL